MEQRPIERREMKGEAIHSGGSSAHSSAPQRQLAREEGDWRLDGKSEPTHWRARRKEREEGTVGRSDERHFSSASHVVCLLTTASIKRDTSLRGMARETYRLANFIIS